MRYTHECSLTYFYPPFNKEFALLTAVCYGNFLWGCFSITHFSVANLVCPVPEDVCGDTAFAEVCRPARGADSTVPLLSVRTPEFLLCSFMTLRGLSLFLPRSVFPTEREERPPPRKAFVLPLHEVCTFPIYL